MNQLTRFLVASSVLSVGLLSSSCLSTNAPSETHYYFGDVYDGVTGAHVTNYHIAVEYFGRRYEGQIDARGGFGLPAIPAYQDFSVYIDADGYRPFVSHQPQWLDEKHADRSYHYEAYLFSTALAVQDVQVNVTLSDSPQLPTGQIRLRPVDLSDVYNDVTGMPKPSEQPAGIPGQVWTNSYDLLAQTVWVDIVGGLATFPGQALVYGVPYQVAILNVPGYQYTESPVFQAGMDGRRAFVLTPLDHTPLAVSYKSTDSGNPTPDGSLTIIFNQPAEFDPLHNLDGMKEAIDDQFSITSPDFNANGQRNTLKLNVSPAVQERGTSMVLDGQKLVFTWSTDGLATSDQGDPIRSVTWDGLDAIYLRPQGGNAADVVVLSNLLGSNAVNVVVLP